MQRDEIEDLIKRYQQGICSAEEAALLETWYAEWNRGKSLDISDELLRQDLEANRHYVLSKVAAGKRTMQLWPRIALAAAALAAIVFGIWFFSAPSQPELVSGSLLANDIAPGKNTAAITLSNGKTIVLSDRKTGVVINGNELSYNDGSLVASPGMFREAQGGSAQSRVTVSTPRGGTYQVTLADGTKVWLNAASNLTYSTGLNEHGERSVNLSGEAYFEVAKDARHPFIVHTSREQIEVLGTHFNISSYSDETTTRTTLLEGSVKINDIVLRPGQQALLTDGLIKVISADIEAEVAWKNGDFVFSGADFRSVMREITRWYNVTVEYDDSVPDDIRLEGWVSREKNLSVVLRRIESIGNVHFKVEGRRITVTQ